VAQENHHLTTEQFSAHLDGQLSDAEQSLFDAHLKTCEQCQQELTDLRRTVALLHAMPRPALPRSFVLPLDIQPSAGDQVEDHDEVEESDHAPIALAAARARHSATSGGKPSRRRWPTYVRTALRTVSAIAAVIGLVFFLSGVFTSLPHGSNNAAMSTASQANEPQVKSNATNGAKVAANNSTNTGGTVVPQLSPSSLATIIPQGSTPETRATATSGGAAVRTPAAVNPQKPIFSTAASPSQAPTILFFDLSNGPGRLGFGFLLLLLGIMGYVVFKRRRQQEQV
jgi:hypothetical protein